MSLFGNIIPKAMSTPYIEPDAPTVGTVGNIVVKSDAINIFARPAPTPQTV